MLKEGRKFILCDVCGKEIYEGDRYVEDPDRVGIFCSRNCHDAMYTVSSYHILNEESIKRITEEKEAELKTEGYDIEGGFGDKECLDLIFDNEKYKAFETDVFDCLRSMNPHHFFRMNTNHFTDLYESKIIMIDEDGHEEIFLESPKMFYNEVASKISILLDSINYNSRDIFKRINRELSYEYHEIVKK
jgi:hypothetical protein